MKLTAKIAKAIALLLAFCLLMGCSLVYKTNPDTNGADSSKGENAASDTVSDKHAASSQLTAEEIEPPTTSELPENATDKQVEDYYTAEGEAPSLEMAPAEPDAEAQPANYSPLDSSEYYCYNQLTEVQQKAYQKLYTAAQTMNTKVFSVGKMTKADASIALVALRCDWPQIFWLDSAYGIGRDQRGLVYVSFCGDGYGYTVKDAEARQKMFDKINDAVDKAIGDCLTAGMTEYERELALHDWICENMTYDDAAAESTAREDVLKTPHSWTVYGGLVQGKGVCESYAKVFQLLLYSVGIQCTNVVGQAKSGEGHMWSAVRIDGNWYNTDVTWDDSETGSLPYVHAYFNFNDEDAAVDREASPAPGEVDEDTVVVSGDVNVKLPECTSRQANFFVMNGTWISDSAAFGSIVIPKLEQQLTASNSVTVEFRCGWLEKVSKNDVKDLCQRSGVYAALVKIFRNVKTLKYDVYSKHAAFYIRAEI